MAPGHGAGPATGGVALVGARLGCSCTQAAARTFPAKSPDCGARQLSTHPPTTPEQQRTWPTWPDAGQSPISEGRRQAWRMLPAGREAGVLTPAATRGPETRDTPESHDWWGTRGRCPPAPIPRSHPPPRKQLAVQPTATGNGREQPGPLPRARLVARLPVLSPGGRPDLAPRQAPTGAKRMDLNVSPGHSPPGLPSLPGCPGPPGRGVPEGIQQAELASPQCPAGRAQLPCRPPGLTSRAVRLGLLWKGVDQVIAQRWPFTLKLAT